MTNTNLLRQKIEESGLKLQFIADKLGISRATLTAKINGTSEFNQTEIQTLCDLLNIKSLKEKNSIFFFNVQTKMPTSGKATVKVIIHGSTDRQKLIYAAEKFAKDILKEKKDEKKSIKTIN